MIAYTCKDTAIILITILTYIMIFSVFSYYLFRSEFEGIAILEDNFESYYQFLILLTTANFPDVMLPAYENSFWYASIFVIYLIVGLYFLLNILLANVFSMYKKRLEMKKETRSKMRIKRISEQFDRHDIGEKGYLTYKEAKAFFARVLDLKFNKAKHQKMFIKIMK